jgi:hypothetical protein
LEEESMSVCFCGSSDHHQLHNGNLNLKPTKPILQT